MSPLPGQIIDSVELSPTAGTRVWSVLYSSTGLDGQPIEVSGLILAPAEATNGATYPIVAWAHGTVGIADECAPSRMGYNAVQSEVQRLVALGYVITATDYEGLGTEGTHPYLVGTSEGRSVLDAIRAVRNLPDAHAAAEAVVIGASQGGQAALWAGELAPTYAPELDVRGVIAGSPPTDMLGFASGASELGAEGAHYGGVSALLMFGVWNELYDLPLDFLSAAGRQAAVNGLDSCVPGEVSGSPYLADPATLPDWARRLTENSPGHTRSDIPILVVSPDHDDLVPYESQVAGVAAMCDIGDTVELRTVSGDHGVSNYMAPQWEDYRAWIADRLSGVAPISTC